ncbi:60S ribosomal protein L15 [Datura stramonium]|uniref:60S ribosomal protein L15 n=1 Tax=Datura stramonium TaxID=4076 RepID=A0ABS8TQT0_DATST|nr:60S ribosomal protein L15 [Datura stramonium]
MASLLSVSISSAAPTRTKSIVTHISSSFKGNVRNLKSSSNLFPSINTSVRFRLNNLGPQPGATKNRKRKGRGHSAGQGGSCGFGMRGQKSRSGPGVQKGVEGVKCPSIGDFPS